MKTPEPFHRTQTDSWYVQIGKRQIPLGKDEAAARRKYHQIMAGHHELNPSAPVAYIVDEFLEWVKQEKADATYHYYQRYLKSFVEHIGHRLPISDLKALHVTRWVAAKYSTCSETSRNSVISTVQRAMNWAVRQGIVLRSPIFGIEKPPRHRREVFITPEQYAAILDKVKDQPFRDFIVTLWETGCRPQEITRVEARHFIADRGVWLFERVESKGKKKRRLVMLNETAKEITTRLATANPTGKLFRNTDSNPWTKDAINCRFRRLREKLDFPMNATAFRHGFVTDTLNQGLDTFSVSKLTGHSDTRMVESVYQHLDGNDEFLRGALKRAKRA